MGFLPFILALPLIEIAGFVLLGPYLGVGGTLAEIKIGRASCRERV